MAAKPRQVFAFSGIVAGARPGPGHAGDVIKRREAWLERNGAALTAALTAP